ncbi:MAG: hypothetical protein ACD_29C00247G0002 [uncultured bacterium]|nr:MAG: hypothetical protein ACD_29C00247G0002 [uncultured bacterium]
MSIFHDLSIAKTVAQPMSLMGNYLSQFFIVVKLFISTFGTFTILVGAIIAIFRYCAYRFFHPTVNANLNNIRLDLARTIILGLEFFIASDVIETTITPDFQSLGILCVLVIIRTLLNFSLHKEVKELSMIPGSGVDYKDEKNK